jgi:hypothetical protein
MKVLLEDQVKGKTTGSSLKGYINCTYQDLVRALGEPTYSTPSGDNKVQKEWVVKYNGEVFTIYDWKTYDEEYTMNELDQFHIGGKTDAYDFFLELNEMIDGEE